MPNYYYDRMQGTLSLGRENIADQTLARDDGPSLGKVVLHFSGGPKITLHDGEFNSGHERSGDVSLKAGDHLRDYSGSQYSLFSMQVNDVSWEFSTGCGVSFVGWVTEGLQFYPEDWAEKPVLEPGDDYVSPIVLAPNLPSRGKPMRVRIYTQFQHKDWTI